MLCGGHEERFDWVDILCIFGVQQIQEVVHVFYECRKRHHSMCIWIKNTTLCVLLSLEYIMVCVIGSRVCVVGSSLSCTKHMLKNTEVLITDSDFFFYFKNGCLHIHLHTKLITLHECKNWTNAVLWCGMFFVNTHLNSACMKLFVFFIWAELHWVSFHS